MCLRWQPVALASSKLTHGCVEGPLSFVRSHDVSVASYLREHSMQIDDIRERLTRLETSCLCDAKKTLRCLDPAIRPLRLGVKLVGRAFTVACCNDFLTVIKALHDAAPGDVLVVDGQQGRQDLAGELFGPEAKQI